MWQRKRFIIISLLAGALLVGSIVGIAFAQTENGDDSQPKTLLDRVAEILAGKGINITSEQLGEAFSQAQSEMRDEALDRYLQDQVEQGRITQEQADQYKSWWQARPDMEPFRQQLEEWQKARPDMPLPGPFGHFDGHGFHGGMKWGGGRYFWGR